MDQTRFLIVGGGITSLAFAAALQDKDYLVCEADSELGGYCKTVKQDGFVWDYSGHFFHFRHKHIEEELVAHIGKDRVRTVVKDSRIFWQGSHIDFPFQKNIHQLPHPDFLDCLVGLFERPEAAPANFYEMLYSKFGKGISDRFLVPYNEKLYATDLRRLDVGAMGRFFPYADVSDIIRGFRGSNNASYNATFTYPEGGAIEYVHAVASKVTSERICLNERILKVDLRRKVATTSKREIGFEYLISAAPFPQLLGMTGFNAPKEIYSYNKVLVFNLGFDRKGPPGVHWIYYPQRDLVFYRLGFYDNIFDTDRLSMYVEIGFPGDEPVDARTIEELRLRVLADLDRVGVTQGHKLQAWHQVVLDPAYVHITQGSLRDVAEKKAILATRGVYSMGRYGSWTYCSIEDNIVEARELAARFNALP
jgi:protoporphyrinogen oxidase